VAVDAMLVVACYLTIVIDALLDDRLEWWIVALAALNTMPLLWRRRYPLLVTAVVGITTGWLDLAYQLIEIPAASLVATYTFAALCPPLRRLICVVGTVIGVTASITVPGEELLNLGPNAILFVVAYALGTSARARRARMEMLEERARRLAEEQGTAAARERELIAREMHDILAHSMSLVVVQAEAGPVAVRTDPDKAEELLAPAVTRRLIADVVARSRHQVPPRADARLATLTTRETDTLRQVARGLSNAEVAAELHVTEHTVKTHVSSVLTKLGLRDRVQAVVLAYESGLVQPGEAAPPAHS
jgi:DNA-binding CsgD family transcriptional regulator